MTAGNNGGGKPEDDDPFAYLYRREDGGTADSGTAAQQPGVPRTSYHQVRRVGQTNYGQRAQQAGQRQGPAAQPGPYQQAAGQQQYGQPPGQDPVAPAGRAARRDSGQNGNRSLLIGAVAMVAAVALGIGIAVWAGDDEAEPQAREPAASASPQPGDDNKAKPEKSPKAEKTGLPPVTDAASLELSGGAKTSTEYSGAFGKGGRYVDGMQTPGAAVTWKFTVPEAGEYRFNIRYANAGKDVKATLVVNGKTQSINLGNFSKQTDWSKAWTRSWGAVRLEEGENIIDLTCGAQDGCRFNVDQVAITKSGYPPHWP